MSINPGATASPETSIRRADRSALRSPILGNMIVNDANIPHPRRAACAVVDNAVCQHQVEISHEDIRHPSVRVILYYSISPRGIAPIKSRAEEGMAGKRAEVTFSGSLSATQLFRYK